jgi:hypothetical protein
MTRFQSMRSLRTAALLAVVLSFAACGSSSPPPGGAAGSTGSSGSTGGAGKGVTGAGGAAALTGTPVQLCQRLVSTICMRLLSCGVLMDPTMFNQADCERLEDVDFGCDRATSNAFPDCVSDVTVVSCGGLFSKTQGLQLPPSCDDPVNTIPLSPAQSKCADLAAVDCMRLAECLNITPTADQLQQCQIDEYSSVGCGLAIDVGPTYQQCYMDLGKAPCPTDAGTTPDGGVPSCENAIIVVQ